MAEAQVIGQLRALRDMYDAKQFAYRICDQAIAALIAAGQEREQIDAYEESERKAMADEYRPAPTQTFEAGPDECDTGVALTKAIDAVIAEDDAAAQIGKQSERTIEEVAYTERRMREARLAAEAATIERCKRTVKQTCAAWGIPAVRILAALDKLKEEVEP